MSSDTPIKVEISVDKEEYKRGEPIKIKFSITNKTNSTLVLTFRTAKMFDIFLLDKDKKIIGRWAKDKVFAQMITNLTLGPLETLERVIPWNVFKDVLIFPGEYYLEGYVETMQGRYSSNLVKIRIK
ncbi:MAG: hypothetical protein J7L07_00280 [Candidatus Odinarchaeota archaeon]|nr:hypothetical protein [Candidatus Odinarchaeota archaeon]